MLFRTFGLGVELRPSLASLANGGGVDERSEFLRTCCQTSLLGIPTLFVCTNLHVVREKAVEKVDVGVAKNREVLVLLDVGLLHLEDAKAFAQLSVRCHFTSSLPRM